jgi:hypothetical protein
MGLFSDQGMAFTIEGLSLKMLTFAGKKIESWYSIPLNPNFVRDGLVAAPQEIGKIMAEAIQGMASPATVWFLLWLAQAAPVRCWQSPR